MADEQPQCSGPGDNFTGSIGLRVGAIFILWVSSTVVTLFPILTRRVPRLHIHREVFDFAKYFGSGVIIATAFIHLLAPGVEELSSPCLNDHFQNYPFAFAFAMIALFAVFVVELFAYRLGSKWANKLAYNPHMGGHHHALEHHGGLDHDHAHEHHDHNHGHVAPAAKNAPSEDLEGSAADVSRSSPAAEAKSIDDASTAVALSSQASEIVGVLILEFGVIFHSVIIGITLGTTTDFTVLFIVIIFHQMFEGLGLGSRLAFLPLKMTSWIPVIGGLAYGLVTPIGLAIGLGIRNTYNGDSATANYVTGIFDSISAGILLYTGTVELLAHEFIFNERIRTASLTKLSVSIVEMMAGAGLMALLGRWA